MATQDPLMTLGIAIGLGMLIGLQRERTSSAGHIGGIRTFPLVSALGAAAGLVGREAGGWLAAAGLLGVVGAAVLANLTGRRRADPEPGVTTEVALMVTYVLGLMLAVGQRDAAVALGVGTAVLLQLKRPLHELVKRLGDQDVRAVLQFALITFVVLPVLPNETYGPFDVLNPYRIWLMVVLVTGLSLAGYVAFRVVGAKKGAMVAGLIGGMISSTATTVSYARLGRSAPGLRNAACAIFLLATVMMYARVIVEMWIVAPSHARTLSAPIALAGAATLVLAALSLTRAGRGGGGGLSPRNPAELRGALLFGGLYAAVVLLVAAGREWFGDSGLYAVAALSGLTDMDAITLSTGRMVERGRLEPDTAWRAVLLASVANLAFKTGIVWTLGGAALARRAALWFSAVAAVSIALLLLW